MFQLSLLLAALTAAPRTSGATVILYCSQDQVFAEPILKEFEKTSGITVKAVYDSEALKTASLANRLRAEKGNPRCDVFWSNEELLARTLESEGITFLHPKIGPQGARSRVMVVPADLPADAAPASFAALTNGAFAGKLAMAYPLYGTTAHHFAFLRQKWGDARWKAWCAALRDNKIQVVDGNSTVVRLVAHGQARVGLTDSDDVLAGQAEGWKIRAIVPAEDALRIHNTVAVLKGAPHPGAAAELAEFLCSKTVSEALIRAGALEPESSDAAAPPSFKWSGILARWNDTRTRLEKGFTR